MSGVLIRECETSVRSAVVRRDITGADEVSRELGNHAEDVEREPADGVNGVVESSREVHEKLPTFAAVPGI